MVTRKFEQTFKAASDEAEKLVLLIGNEIADLQLKTIESKVDWSDVVVAVEVARRLRDIAKFLEGGQ